MLQIFTKTKFTTYKQTMLQDLFMVFKFQVERLQIYITILSVI